MSECVICFDEMTHSYKLECNHIFHSNCMYNLLKHDFINYKSRGTKYIKHNRFRCPLCRSNLSDQDLYKIILTPFEHYKKEYNNSQRKLRQLQKQHMIFNYKFKFKNLFFTPSLYEEKHFLIRDEKFMEDIDKQKNNILLLKEKFLESKMLYLICVG